MNLADFLRQGPLAQQRMADDSAFDRDSELANMMRQHGTVQDPNMVQEPSVLGNLPIDVPQYTPENVPDFSEQLMNLMPVVGMLKAGSKLPMDEASRMGRAKDMGHTVDAYHGTNQDIKAFDPLMRGNVTKARSAKNAHWFVDNPDTAFGYADLAGSKRVDDLIKESEKAERQGKWDDAHNLMVQAEKLDSVNMNSQNIVPVKLRGKFKDYDAEGKWMQDLEESALAEMLEVAKQEGFDGLQLRNFIDEAGYGVHRPATHTAVFNPSNIRSKFAQFDPANKNSGNILAGAGAGFLASQLLGQDR